MSRTTSSPIVSHAAFEHLYGPKFVSVTPEQIQEIKKSMPLDEYMRYIEVHAVPYGNIPTYAGENMKHSLFIATEVVEGVKEGVNHMFVSGAFKLEGGETFEHLDVLLPVMENLRTKLLPKLDRKVYIQWTLPDKTSRLVHPKTIKKCISGETRFEGGLVMPGFPRPVCTTILDPSDLSMTTCVCGGLYSNFNKVKTEGVTFRALGCDPSVVPDRLLDCTLDAAEKNVHAMKILAAVEYPDVFGAPGMRAENEKIWDDFKAEAVPKKQKKLGGQVKLNGPKFFAFAPRVNPKIMAGNLVTRIALGDKDLLELINKNRVLANKVVEAAMHGAELEFSGPHHDFAWTSVGGDPGVFSEPDTVKDDKERTRFFELGIKLVEGALAGDQHSLVELGLREPLNGEITTAHAAAIWDQCYRDLRTGAVLALLSA